ncbi:MAG TPA: hypothetical protein VF092_27090 [Longimicrobium sp.]
MRRAIPPAVCLALIIATTPAAAQEAHSAASLRALDARMQELLATLDDPDFDGEVDEFVPFFPRQGEFAQVVTTHLRRGGDSVAIHRYRTAELPSATKPGGPLCWSFDPGGGEVGRVMDEIPADWFDPRRPWRRVRATRFVPPLRGAGSPVFVEWKIEDGRWVVSAFGEEADEPPPRVLGYDRLRIARDSAGGEPLRFPLPANGIYAGGRRWFEQHEILTLDGLRYLAYGLPRQLSDGDVVRFGSVQGVPVFVEPATQRMPEVVYVAVAPDGLFQPYQPGPVGHCWTPRDP